MPDNRSISYLVCRARSGDVESFGQIYDLLIDRVYRFIYFRIGDKQEAEDLTEQIFLKIWEKLKLYEASSVPFEAWVFRIVRNRVIDYYRTKKREVNLDEAQELEDHKLSVEQEVENNLSREYILDKLNYLPSTYQEIIILRFIEDRENREISQILNKPVDHVRVLQSRAIKALRKLVS